MSQHNGTTESEVSRSMITAQADANQSNYVVNTKTHTNDHPNA